MKQDTSEVSEELEKRRLRRKCYCRVKAKKMDPSFETSAVEELVRVRWTL